MFRVAKLTRLFCDVPEQFIGEPCTDARTACTIAADLNNTHTDHNTFYAVVDAQYFLKNQPIVGLFDDAPQMSGDEMEALIAHLERG